jgi:hypothetical protein
VSPETQAQFAVLGAKLKAEAPLLTIYPATGFHVALPGMVRLVLLLGLAVVLAYRLPKMTAQPVRRAPARKPARAKTEQEPSYAAPAEKKQTRRPVPAQRRGSTTRKPRTATVRSTSGGEQS